MAEAQVISVHSLEQFSQNLEDANKSSKLVLVDFTASWCPPCRIIAPILADYAKRFPHVLFMKVDVDEVKPAAEQFEVEAMPTFVFLKDGKVVDKFVGADKDGLLAAIVKNSAASTA